MPLRNWYKDWFNSPYYHLIYQNRNEDEANEWIIHLLQYLKPAISSTILDVACGKGRHSKIFAEKGFDVTGIALAPENIVEAKQFENDRLHFFVHDMRLPFYVNYFDFAFNFFTSFGFFRTLREHNNAIRTIAESLKPNGVFVLDYMNVQYVESYLKKIEQIEINHLVFYITLWQDPEHFYKQI